jgi:ABC-type molybdate transport system substrate-binding protein
MLDPTVRLGTSTPKADPSGDYAWEVFRRAEAVQPGSRERLEAKAIKLTGGPAAPQPPPDCKSTVSTPRCSGTSERAVIAGPPEWRPQ